MKQQQWKAGLIVALLAAMTGSVALAAAGAAAPTKEPAPTATAPAKTTPAAPTAPAAPAHEELFWPELWKGFHNPAPWLSMGLDQRVRLETGEVWQTLNKDNRTDHRYEYERYRTRWWTKWVLGEDITFNTRLVWEFRTWDEPHTKLQYTNALDHHNDFVTEFNPDEALFDWFSVNIRNIGGMPLTATIGRQDIMFGVGWLVLDASPLDGSRTIGLFDAARFTYDWKDAATKVDLIYANNDPESDRWLKPINDQDRGLIEDKEQAVILYLTNTTWKPIQLEGFLIYKHDEPFDHQLTNFPFIWSEEGDTLTLGPAISGTSGDHWKYRAEGAMQVGTKAGDEPRGGSPLTVVDLGDRRDVLAFGTLDTLEYQFKDPHDNATHVTYEYASGDDPDSAQDERFDLLWGRWPRWSELLIYTWANETRIADVTNLHRLNLGHRISLSKRWQLTADYHALWADQNSGAMIPSSIHLSSSEHFRGHLLTSWLRYKFSDQLYGHFLVEYFINGHDYYESANAVSAVSSDDDAWFFRINLEYVF